MKLIDKFNQFISKVGTDKVMHYEMGVLITTYVTFAYAVLCCSLFTPLYWLYATSAAYAVTFIIAVVKEVLDCRYDWKDIEATMYGGFSASIATLLISIIKTFWY